jgi:arsenical pump membrane protein
LAKYNVTSILGDLLGSGNPILVYGITSVFFANLINNIPMSVLFSTILLGVDSVVSSSGVYATIIGSNIGAFLTPIGALAGIMWLSIIRTNGVDFSFRRFLKYGIVIAPPVLFAALLGLALVSW